jgi:transglutaminase-like putative cysteine protease
MSWRLAVRHTTGYRYARAVPASYNEARMTPLSTDRQTTIDARLVVQPSVRVSRYWDYWGTLVHAFDTHVPHDELVVTASAVVDTGDDIPDDWRPISWDALRDDEVRDRLYEYLQPTHSTRSDARLLGVAADLAGEASDPGAAVMVARDWVNSQLAYQRGATSVSTSALEAWRDGRGVCQDFAHLALALLRAMGIPGRYVSGYFHPDGDAAVGDKVVGESHAWAEAWIGDWQPFDPTNTLPVGSRHVLVARGRDYSDVSPLKGVYSGAPSSTPNVSVELTRLG